MTVQRCGLHLVKGYQDKGNIRNPYAEKDIC